MKVYEEIVEYLASAGVKNFAGMVGSTIAPYVVDVGARSDARYIPVRHEQVAAAIIDAVGRLDRKPSCLTIHGASGALAASLGIAAAARDSTPMLVLNATQERVAVENRWWQTEDVLIPMSSFVKWQTRVERPDRALSAVREALRATVSGRPGVAQVDLPIDVSIDEHEGPSFREETPLAVPSHRMMPDPSLVAEAAGILASGKKISILVGGGAYYSGAAEQIQRLAEMLNAPVANTPTSRSVIDEKHRLGFGPSGILGYEPSNNVLLESETILAIGSRLSDLQTARGTLLNPQAKIIQVNIDAGSIAKEFPVQLEIVSDALTFVETLLEEGIIQTFNPSDDQIAWADSLDKRRHEWYRNWLESPNTSGKVQPTEVIRELIAQLPSDAILTHGAGDHGFYGYAVPSTLPGGHLVSAALGALGCALGYAIGAKLARPNQTVVACVGDGEFMLQLGDLETMVRENLPAIVIVFNNFALGSQRKRLEVYGQPTGVEHGNPDFAELAKLFGADGYRVDTAGSFGEALQAALASGRPSVIDVIVDPTARPPRIAISREAK